MMQNPTTNFIEMIEQERYDWNMINSDGLTNEEYRRMRDFFRWEYHSRKQFEQNCIVQWLYFDEELYRNWIYDLDRKPNEEKDNE